MIRLNTVHLNHQQWSDYGPRGCVWTKDPVKWRILNLLEDQEVNIIKCKKKTYRIFV